MAKIDIRLNNATFYDAQRIDIVEGVSFDASLIEHDGKVKWVAGNDPVLEISEDGANGHNAHILAKKVGKSQINVCVDDDADVLTNVKVLRVNCVKEIQLPASNLGLAAEIVPKENQNL